MVAAILDLTFSKGQQHIPEMSIGKSNNRHMNMFESNEIEMDAWMYQIWWSQKQKSLLIYTYVNWYMIYTKPLFLILTKTWHFKFVNEGQKSIFSLNISLDTGFQELSYFSTWFSPCKVINASVEYCVRSIWDFSK